MDDYKSVFIGALIACAIVTMATPYMIKLLKQVTVGQIVREEGPKSHYKKSGTPTMGGLIMIGATLISALIMGIVTKDIEVFPLVVTVLFGAIGFWDDFIKISKRHNLGLRAWQKLALQTGIALIIAIYAALNPEVGTKVFVPFIGKNIDFGVWFVPFTCFAIVAVTNAVNLTDGLDGLATGVTAIVMFFFVCGALFVGQRGTAIFGGALMGACIGFLFYNSNPAALFMGDTGSMALGGAVISIAILTRLQILVLLAGVIYVAEAISVVIQVGYFKSTHGKRFFKMAPIHHHFELMGWSENKVVVSFCIVTVIAVSVAFLCL